MEDERMSVDERRKYLKLMAPRYGCAGRVERTRLLSEMVAITGLHRKSLLRLLHGPTLERAPKRPRRGERRWATKGHRIFAEEVLMANKRLPMRKIREVLRLSHACGLGEREIARSCRTARATVGNYLKRAEAVGLTWPAAAELSETELASVLFPRDSPVASRERAAPDCQYIYDQLRQYRKLNLTLTQLWLEYKESHPDGYQYTQFCEHYRRWRGKLD